MIEGTWVPIAAEFGGERLPEERLRAMWLVLKADSYEAFAGGIVDRGTLQLDASHCPHAIDITGTEGPNKGKTILAVCELSGDTLRICYAQNDGGRPPALCTLPGTGMFLVTYRRERR